MSRPALSYADMWQSLSASWPSVFKRPADEYSNDYAGCGFIMVGGDAEFDGLPVFPSIFYDADDFDGYLLKAFGAWVTAQGWCWEMEDIQQFILLPDERRVDAE
jgi:hypothetical protein